MSIKTARATSRTRTNSASAPKPPTPRSRGQIIPRGPGKWLVRLTLGTDPAGKRITWSELVQGTRKDADKVRVRKLAERDAGAFVQPPSKQTLESFLSDWLEHTARHSVSARTYADYKQFFRLYVYPAHGSTRLDRLTAQDVQRLYSGMVDQGLAPSTIRKVHAPLRQALGDAVAGGLLPRNPTDSVRPPRLQRREMQTLSLDDAHRLLVGAENDKHAALWNLLISTGMRPGEALALRWTDIQENTVRVQRALSRITSGTYQVAEPKTPGSRRAIPLPTHTRDALAAHRARQAAEILAAGSRYRRNGFVFANAVGAALDPTAVSRRWKRLLKSLGLPQVRLYDCRHTCATLLLTGNIHPKVVQERLGHASIQLTLDTYSHVMPTMQAGATEYLECLRPASAAA